MRREWLGRQSAAARRSGGARRPLWSPVIDSFIPRNIVSPPNRRDRALSTGLPPIMVLLEVCFSFRPSPAAGSAKNQSGAWWKKPRRESQTGFSEGRTQDNDNRGRGVDRGLSHQR